MSIRHRLPLILLLFAVAGALWMLVDRAGVLDDIGLSLRDAPGDDAPETSAAEAEWDEAWDEAPRLIGRASATAQDDGYLRADGTRSGSAGAGGTGAKPEQLGGTTVRFGGVVRGPDGQPATEVKVLLKPSGTGSGLKEVETGANGRFKTELLAGRYDVVFKAEGMGGLNLKAYLVDGATGVDVEFTLRRAQRLEVGIRREGIGIPDATVSATPRQGVGGESTKTDDLGTAVFDGLVVGKYRVEVAMESGEKIIRSLDLRKDESLQVDLPRGIAMHGTIDDADEGGPIAGADVLAWVRGPSGTWIQASAVTDANGQYELEVPQGKVGRFEVTASGYATWPARRQIKTVLKTLRGIEKGKEVQRNIRLTHGLSVTGRVTNQEDEGVEGVEISFKPRRGAPLTTRSGEDGTYELPGIRVERYDVVVLSDGWFTERAVQLRMPRLEPGSVHEFDLKVQGTISIQGQVLHHDKSPASGTRVWISGGGRLLRAAHNAGRDLETFSDTKGWWQIHDLPASQKVAVRAALGSLEAAPRSIRTNALPEKPIELVLGPTATLKGTVTDLTSRRPVRGARIQLRPRGEPSGRTGRTVSTDAQGTFEVFGLIPGPWELTPTKSGYLTPKPQAQDLTGVEGEREVTLYLDPGLVIAGTVATQQGKVLNGARVTISGNAHDGTRVRRYMTTKGNGVFSLTGFQAGAYKLTVRRNGYRNVSIPGLQGGEDRVSVQMKRKSN